jgi:hypothetical protein
MASLAALETNIATGSTLPNGERPVLAVAQDPASPPAPIATTTVPIASLLLITPPHDLRERATVTARSASDWLRKNTGYAVGLNVSNVPVLLVGYEAFQG